MAEEIVSQETIATNTDARTPVNAGPQAPSGSTTESSESPDEQPVQSHTDHSPRRPVGTGPMGPLWFA